MLLFSFIIAPTADLFADGGFIFGAIRGLILVGAWVGTLVFGLRAIAGSASDPKAKPDSLKANQQASDQGGVDA